MRKSNFSYNLGHCRYSSVSPGPHSRSARLSTSSVPPAAAEEFVPGWLGAADDIQNCTRPCPIVPVRCHHTIYSISCIAFSDFRA